MTTTRDAILQVVTACGGDVNNVGPLDRDALDRLLDTLAGEDIHTSAGALNADVISAMAQYAHGGGGGGGSTVEVRIIQVAGEQSPATAYFTAKNSAGESITPVLHEEQGEEGSFNYFTVAVDAGSVVTLESIDNSGYTFNANATMYRLDEQPGIGAINAPIKTSSSSVTFVAVNDVSYPDAFIGLMLSSSD